MIAFEWGVGPRVGNCQRNKGNHFLVASAADGTLRGAAEPVLQLQTPEDPRLPKKGASAQAALGKDGSWGGDMEGT